MILNKGSVERGFAHATVYKCDLIDLMKKGVEWGKPLFQFGLDPSDSKTAATLDVDGLPKLGTLLKEGEPYYR